MDWIYNVRNRTLTKKGKPILHSRYAGAPGYKDNPEFECKRNKGPLPRGRYQIIGVPFTHKIAGRYTLRLQAYASNSMCGRDGFLIHGDSRRDPGTASNGCIVADYKVREAIWNSNDRELIVE